MALSKSTQNNDVDLIDTRPGLYYGKYNYRARFYCQGIHLAWFCENDAQVDKRINQSNSAKARHKHTDVVGVKKFIAWRNNNPFGKGNQKLATIRIEGNVAAVFSNDLIMLKSLDTIGNKVDYTMVDSSIPEGIKYFKNEPEHKYRIYLKSKRVTDDFHQKLKNFVQRYKDTDNKMVPSPSLNQWLRMDKDANKPAWFNNNWKLQYCSSHFFLDYNEESSLTLFTLVFQGWINRKFKLEKQP